MHRIECVEAHVHNSLTGGKVEISKRGALLAGLGREVSFRAGAAGLFRLDLGAVREPRSEGPVLVGPGHRHITGATLELGVLSVPEACRADGGKAVARVEGVDPLGRGVVPDPHRRRSHVLIRLQEFDAQRIGGLPIRKLEPYPQGRRGRVERGPRGRLYNKAGPSLNIFFVPPQRLGGVVDAPERLFALLDVRELRRHRTAVEFGTRIPHALRQRPRSFPEPLRFGPARRVDGVPGRRDLFCEALVLGRRRVRLEPPRLLIARAGDERNYNSAVAGRDRALRVGEPRHRRLPRLFAMVPGALDVDEGRGGAPALRLAAQGLDRRPGAGAARHEGIVYRGRVVDAIIHEQNVRAHGQQPREVPEGPGRRRRPGGADVHVQVREQRLEPRGPRCDARPQPLAERHASPQNHRIRRAIVRRHFLLRRPDVREARRLHRVRLRSRDVLGQEPSQARIGQRAAALQLRRRRTVGGLPARRHAFVAAPRRARLRMHCWLLDVNGLVLFAPCMLVQQQEEEDGTLHGSMRGCPMSSWPRIKGVNLVSAEQNL
ncbi:unnamed protein product [Pelagomonas calceolata]|uniref:Uncharacterized protein n=1 Tax=Pelagomonas calceolata TaxID=35677 RepID=A0A8J2X1D3_9STRA|nr:unnamed protein product [Pelagomonas calceolata]